MKKTPGIAAISNADWDLDPLVALQQMCETRDYLDFKIEEAVRQTRAETRAKGTHIDHVAGRANGIDQQENITWGLASWQEIADALGTSRQAAHRKYAHLIEG